MSNTIETYFPDPSELTSTQIREARDALEAQYRTVFPDLDMRPNSVFGDLWLTPAATHLASLDVALSRYKSDLDLENVSRGVIWDCDFVEAYLRNFSTLQDSTVLSYGTIRLVVNQDTQLELDRNLEFRTDGGSVYYLRLPEDGDLTILPSGSTVTAGQNQEVLTPTASDGWVVDVAVEGTYTEDDLPEEGTTFSPTEAIATLISATALFTFSSGQPDTRLKTVAQKTQDTIHTATPVTKQGVISFMYRNFPDLLGVSAVTSADPVLLRSGTNPVDVYMRSRTTVTDEITVRARLDTGLDKFVAEIQLPALPILIDDVVWAGDPDLVLEGDDVNLYLQSKDDSQWPLWSCANSDQQKLWLVVDMPYENETDTDYDDTLITTQIIDGQEYADFTITYRQDPHFRAMARTLTSEQNTPVGVDLLCKMPVAVYFERFDVRYRKTKGATVDLATAREEVLAYMNGIMYRQQFSEARIADTLLYAGAEDLDEIDLQARVLYGPADWVVASATVSPLTDLSTFLAAAVAMPSTTWTSADMLRNQVLYPAQYAGVNTTNLQYILDTTVLDFSEVS